MDFPANELHVYIYIEIIHVLIQFHSRIENFIRIIMLDLCSLNYRLREGVSSEDGNVCDELLFMELLASEVEKSE